MPLPARRSTSPEQALEGVEEGLQLGQLRADVAVDADHPGGQARRRGRRPPRPRRWRCRTCSLSGRWRYRGWVWASTSGLTRSDTGAFTPSSAATRCRRSSSSPDSTLKQCTPTSGRGACRRGSCRRRRTPPCRIAAGGQDTLQLTAGNDVETGAEARQHIQHPEVELALTAKQTRCGMPARASA